MKSLSIMFALICLTLCGCINHELSSDGFFVAPKEEPHVIKVRILGAIKANLLHKDETGECWTWIPYGTPLREVISVGAGGFDKFADKKRVRVSRWKPGSDDNLEKIFFDFTQTDDRKVEEVLRNGDTIYVPEDWSSESENKPNPTSLPLTIFNY